MNIAEEPGIDFSELQTELKPVLPKAELYKSIVNLPFKQPLGTAFLFLGFICLYIADEDKKLIKLVAASDNDYYHMSIRDYDFDESNFYLPISAIDNDIARAYKTGQPQSTSDWGKLSRTVSAESEARLNQANSGIGHSVMYPLAPPAAGVLGFFFYRENIGSSQYEFMEQYVKLVSKSLA